MCCKFELKLVVFISPMGQLSLQKKTKLESILPQNTVDKCFTMVLLSKVSRFHLMTPVCQLCLLYYAEGFHVQV